jgi:GT2 family glycosyltransferase
MECLSALRQQPSDLSMEVIVVDNASQDGSADAVSERFSDVKVIRNRDNVGFAVANNQALRLASGEYALLLNSDAIVSDVAVLGAWVAFMDAHPDTGASGCRLVYPDGSRQVGDAGYRPSAVTLLNHFFMLSAAFPGWFRGLYLGRTRGTHPVRVDWICGAAFLVRRSILADVGYLNEDVFMFAEDIEWGCRIAAAGYDLQYLPGLEIIHLQGASSSQQPDGFATLWMANLRKLYYRLNPTHPKRFFDAVVFAGLSFRIGLCALHYVFSRNDATRWRLRRLRTYCAFVLRGAAT